MQANGLGAYFALVLLVDLHVPDDRLPALKDAIGQALDGQSGPVTHGFHHFLFAETTDGTPASTAGKKAAAEKTTASKSAAGSAGGKKATTARPAAKKTASRKRSA
ncbi:hypothetical protein [Streptomyces collinus]|uniref:hypothetical protein n=1 Tax=Streptomyces collinus TaxID=42684 RepID=UPI0036EC9FDC